MKRTSKGLFYWLLVAGLTTQAVLATENYHARKERHSVHVKREQLLNSNAYAPPAATQPDISRFEDEALSPPAGR